MIWALLKTQISNQIIKKSYTKLFFKKKDIKNVFDSFFFFKGNNKILCIFLKNDIKFINVVSFLEIKQFFYSYKNCFSNIVLSSNILKEYEKYKDNYIYIQFILKKIKIKIILLFLFLFISFIKNIK